MYDNTDKFVVFLSMYLNLFSVIGLLIFLPLHYITYSIRERSKTWARISYVLKKFSYLSLLCLFSMYTVTLSLWIISLFSESMKSTDIFVAFIVMMIIGFVIWVISLFAYLVLTTILSVFGVTLLSLFELKNQLTKK